MKMEKVILLVFFFLASLHMHGQNRDSLEVTKATQNFIKSFVDFNWTNFRNAFSNDATIFFPTWEEGKRRTGRKEFEETWSEIFPEFIDTSKKYDLKIDPKNVIIQLYGNTAIVTFHLISSETYLSRRTVVLVKEDKEWKIVHLHASGLSKN